MKVILRYEDNDNPELHKTLKITLPKSWKTGPTSKLLGQFVESYNANETLGPANPLAEDSLHLAVRKAKENDPATTELVDIASDAVTVEAIPDYADVYVMHGPAKTLQQMEEERVAERRKKEEEIKNTVPCTHFGCKNRFPKGGPYPECLYHKSPPVFHETAKFWSCCPQKKAYDWEQFQSIPGCQKGICSEVKEDQQKLFLGGTDLREAAGEAVKLKSIDDFNKAQAAGGSEAAPVLSRLQVVLEELGVEKELYNQVVDGFKSEFSVQYGSDAEILEAVKVALGLKIKEALKATAAEQLRIKY